MSNTGNETRSKNKRKDKTKQREKPGDFDKANDDFDNLKPQNVRPIPGEGRSGDLPNGDKVNVRPGSSDGRPTVETQSGKKKTKVRYGEN